jgi:anti-sigma B factor antagonist
MEVNATKNGDSLLLKVSGRIDTTTAPELENKVDALMDGIKKIVFDFQDLEYISSAGLRLLLHYQKEMLGNGESMVIKNVNEFVMEVFEMTGFKEILTIEE